MTVMNLKQPAAASPAYAQLQAVYAGVAPSGPAFERPALCVWFDGAMHREYFEEAALVVE